VYLWFTKVKNRNKKCLTASHFLVRAADPFLFFFFTLRPGNVNRPLAPLPATHNQGGFRCFESFVRKIRKPIPKIWTKNMTFRNKKHSSIGENSRGFLLYNTTEEVIFFSHTASRPFKAYCCQVATPVYFSKGWSPCGGPCLRQEALDGSAVAARAVYNSSC
jgi:hypothetical protein